MAFDPKKVKGKIFLSVGGVDESTSLTTDEPSVANTGGVFPYFYGIQQRMFGKKTIDFNPDQQVFGIHQTFNGVCLYGYYVQTHLKLYYHACDAPPDLRIKFWPNV